MNKKIAHKDLESEKKCLSLQSKIKGSYQSGQMGLTVTQLSFDFGGSNPSLPTCFCGNSSVDRALAFQAGGRGFESRFPLGVIEKESLLISEGFFLFSHIPRSPTTLFLRVSQIPYQKNNNTMRT